ncbi:MAG: FadR/GntR family transcriptional regulator [Nitriliruptorales bacterium]
MADATLFRPVSPGRVSAEIVKQIKSAIREGRLATGDRLPPERELTELFGVSRVTVRDALRVLEANGLVDIRVGAGGGAFVTAPGSDNVAEGISNMLLLRSTTPQAVTETRIILEVGMLPFVCERATEEDLAELERLCDKGQTALEGGDDYDVSISAEFHTALAQATHNPVIEALTHSLHQPLEASLRTAKRKAPQMGREGVREHRALVAAIRGKDPEKAQEIMRRHLARTAKRVKDGSGS